VQAGDRIGAAVRRALPRTGRGARASGEAGGRRGGVPRVPCPGEPTRGGKGGDRAAAAAAGSGWGRAMTARRRGTARAAGAPGRATPGGRTAALFVALAVALATVLAPGSTNAQENRAIRQRTVYE